MAKKLIDIGEAYYIRFDQRAPGQETPYWVGSILSGGKEIGSFENSGTGGPTLIRSQGGFITKDFRRMFDNEAIKQGVEKAKLDKLIERESLMIEFAEAKGYQRGWKSATFAEFVTATIAGYRKHGMM